MSTTLPRLLLAAATAAALSGCGDDPVPVPESVTVTPATLTFDALGQTSQLTAVVRSDLGETMPEATVTWSVADAAVASVSGGGLVTALAPGSTSVTATVTGGGPSSGAVDVDVEQVVTAISVDAPPDSVFAGETLQLTASASDAGGSVVAGASVTWASSDEAVATVDDDGLVSAVDAGEATVTASVGSHAAEAALRVVLQVLAPTEDMELSGTMKVASLAVPAGVTLTATDGLELVVEGDATIEGTVAGDCVPISVNATGDLTVRGTLTNSCSEAPDTDAPAVMLLGAGAVLFEDAVIEASGALTVGASGDTLAAPIRSSAMRDDEPDPLKDCAFIRTSVGSRERPVNKSPTGDGRQHHWGGPKTEIVCYRNLLLEGVAVIGADGVDGESAAGPGVQTASAGRSGGEIRIYASNDITIRPSATGPTILAGGNGGNGGYARSTSSGDAPAVANAGRGGDASGMEVTSSLGRITIEGPRGLVLSAGNGGRGGDATATGGRGADGEGTTAPTVGQDARASAGGGGGTGIARGVLVNDPGGDLRIRSALFSAGFSTSGEENVEIQGGTAGHGGIATAEPGDGGAATAKAPTRDGAAAGQAFIVGGSGGDVDLQDNRRGAPDPSPGIPGNAGDLVLRGGEGGAGYSDCKVADLSPGGDGGEGASADLILAKTRGGSDGSTTGTHGILLRDWFGRGGNGGDGPTAGTGGDGGTIAYTIGQPGSVVDMGTSLRRGNDGKKCTVSHDSEVSVTADPAGHEPFLGMTAITTLTTSFRFVMDANGDEVPHLVMNLGGVELSGLFDAETGSASLRGNGTLAGFAGVLVESAVTVVPDEEGRTGALSGAITVGGEGRLPGGQSAKYSLTANPKPSG